MMGKIFYYGIKMALVSALLANHADCSQIEISTFLSQFLKLAPQKEQAVAQSEQELSLLKQSRNPWSNQLSATGQWFQEKDLVADSTTGKGESYSLSFSQDLPTGTQLTLSKNYTHYREDSLGKGEGNSWEFELSQDLLQNGFGKNNFKHFAEVSLQKDQGLLLQNYANSQDCLTGGTLFAELWLSQKLALEAVQTAELAKKVQATYRRLLSQKLLPERFWPGIQLDTMARERDAQDYERQFIEKIQQAKSYSVIVNKQDQFQLPQSLINNLTNLSSEGIKKTNVMAIKENELKFSRLQAEVADNENLPRLEAFLNYDENKDDYIIEQTNEDEKKFGLRLTIRPLESWQQNAIAAKRSQVRLDEIKLNETARELEVEMYTLAEKIKLLKAQQMSFEVETKLASDQLKTNQLLFQEGRIDLTDYQSARDKLSQTKLAQIKNTYELLLAILKQETTLRNASSYCPSTKADQ